MTDIQDNGSLRDAFLKGVRWSANAIPGKSSRPEEAAWKVYPNTSVPPHAAGENAAIAIRGDHLKDITTQSATLTVSTGDGTIQQSCNLAGCDGRCGICSPAASQAAPEMPENIEAMIGDVRDSIAHGDKSLRATTIVWLADRVAELERERQEAHDYMQTTRPAPCGISRPAEETP